MLIGWFVRLVVVLGLVAVVALDTVTVAAAHLGTVDDANAAARAAASAFHAAGSLPVATQAASAALGSHDEQVVPGSVRVLPGGLVSLQLRRTVRTIVLHDIPGLARLATVQVAGRGSPSLLAGP